MEYVRKLNGVIFSITDSPYRGTAWYDDNGYIPNLTGWKNVDITGGAINDRGITIGGTLVKLEDPEAEEWVDKARFIDAITVLIPDESKPVVAGDWRTLAWIAQLPGDAVNLLDPRVELFLAQVGLALDAVRAEMGESK